MSSPDLIELFVVPLNRLNLHYMVTGAVAAVIYGEPRLTRDLDVVVALRPGDVEGVAAAFPAEAFYVPPRDVIEHEAARALHGHFNVIHTATALKVDCYVAGEDPLHAWAMTRRVRHEVRGVDVWVAPIEYVIVRKLEWHRAGGGSRHLDDIRAMLRVSREAVDGAALQEWVARRGLADEWKAVADA